MEHVPSWQELERLVTLVTCIIFAVRIVRYLSDSTARLFQFFARLELHMIRMEGKVDRVLESLERGVSHGEQR